MDWRPLALAICLAVGWPATSARGDAPAQDGDALVPPGEPNIESPGDSNVTIEERFARATERIADGDVRRAAEELAGLASDAPDSPLASDALFSAARLFEERLGEPARALALYDRLEQRYPDSRTALAAGRRAASLRQQMGPQLRGATPLARFNQILHQFPGREEDESLALMEALLAEFPGWSGRARGLLWMASVHQRGERLERALVFYLEAAEAAPDPGDDPRDDDTDDMAFQAWRGAGEVATAMGAFDRAREYYERMSLGADPARQRAIDSARQRAIDPARQRTIDDSFRALAREVLRARLYRAAVIALVLAFLGFLASLRRSAGSWRGVPAALWPPAPEVTFMIPIAALLCAASLTSHQAIGPAVTIVCVGGVAVAWLSGAALRRDLGEPTRDGPTRATRQTHSWTPLAHAAVAALAIVALCYIALHRGRLIDMIIDTVRFGPDV